MSEAVHWNVKPWEWQRVPEWWMDRLGVYLSAKSSVWPELQSRIARRNARAAQ